MDRTSAAVARVCVELGLPAPVLVRRGSSDVFRSAGVALHAVPAAHAARQRRAVQVLRTLTRQGFDVPRLLEPVHLVRDGVAVLLTEWVEGVPPGGAALARLGVVVAALHAVPTRRLLETGLHLDDVVGRQCVRVRQRAAALGGRLPAQQVVALRDAAEQLVAAVASPGAWGEPVLVHGDLHPGNALVRADGSLVLLDWDDVGCGPAVYDYVSLYVQATRFGQAEDDLRDFTAGYGTDLGREEGLAELARLRLLSATLWLAGLDRTAAIDRELDRRLQYWTGEPDPPLWSAR